MLNTQPILPRLPVNTESSLAWPPRKAAVGSLVLLFVLAMMDRMIPDISLAAAMVLPLLFYAWKARCPVPFWLLIMAVILSMAVYMTKPVTGLPQGVDRLLHPRMCNRGLSLLVMAIWTLLSIRANHILYADPNRDEVAANWLRSEEFFVLVDRLLLGVSAVLLMAAVFIGDLVVPLKFNLSILYSIPLLLCLLATSPRLLKYISPVLLLLPLADYFWEWFRTGEFGAWYFLFNRLIVAVTMLAVTLMTLRWIHQRVAQKQVSSVLADGLMPLS